MAPLATLATTPTPIPTPLVAAPAASAVISTTTTLASHRSKTATSLPPPPPPPRQPSRLRDYYLNSLRDDIMTLSYDHYDISDPATTTSPELAVTEEDHGDLAADTSSVEEATTPPQRRRIGRGRPKRPPVPPSTPDLVYGLNSLTVHIRMREAIENKYNLLSALMALQCITGRRAEVVYSRSDAALLKLRKGMPLSVKVQLEGDDMYAFLDKLVEVVLPQIKEWRGLSRTAGDSNGCISFGFGPHVMGLFPDIEGVYDMIPKITGFHVSIDTSAPRDPPARTVLSAFQIPFNQPNAQ
ncbi:ribosomal protein L5 domain-containing protein [Dimargaris cristalligena]|uniref:Ribosomal protein L5 domain-containing protein n=1 Tax=Dimargaris cristalligena TaxID=215637 RepID=A0A4V1J5R3_9FUNG|nr:ribosomal protein L5 domain-containing protein [Dimargaris cristalligena]|eukprot:RKP39959.1 ribosomal protein L5 domain-containing protein [Dimargaris cristalligena]